eukprot:SAG11_NODE_413_length_9694_cov_2.695675_11_plen_36_part_00
MGIEYFGEAVAPISPYPAHTLQGLPERVRLNRGQI